ncbi:MAG TPA: hypothetical protein VFO31_20120 [Vicinamibacterales bacterium]|nr:hypothetical protein [Vicinamibacterales bacterium]
MRLPLVFACLVACCTAWAQAPDVAWPRAVKAADGSVITVYQPQVESWTDNNLSGRAAVAVKRPNENEPHYGVIELAARTAVDKSADLVTLSSVRITKSSFQGASAEESQKYLAALRASVTKQSWPVSAQALQANLAVTQARSKQKTVEVKNDPPQIIFRNVPSMLVMVDGEPALRPAKDVPSLWRVINTAALILQDPTTKTYSLWAVGRWFEAKELAADWKPAASPPASLEKARAALGKEFDPLEGKTAEGKSVFEPGTVPQILVATKPTELLQSKGEPQLLPIPGTQLLYMANSPNDIFLQLGPQTYFVLISGRWFSAKALTGPWAYVPGKSLPADFARIPPDHQMADVLVSVPGTQQAREAVIANQIPQTATVQRDVQPTPVAFDGGKPEWKAVDKTPLDYAPNTPAPVIRVDPKTYYMVQNGVWFTATGPEGPYVVATTVPSVIYTIPPSSPIHYVTYVRVYSSTPATVVVGYTPGYYGTVTTVDNVVVYGTGYAYPVYVGTVWYPPPPTYGFAFGFTVGMFWGFAMSPPYHYPCCHGGGVYVSHHNHINIDNSYNRWGGKSSTITGPGGKTAQTRQVGQTTLAKGAGSNDVYAGRDGQVYRRDDSGQWQQYGGKDQGWSNVERPQGGERPAQQPASTRDRAQQPSAETRQSLDRQHQSREAGAQRAQDFRAGPPAGFQGGGGYRGGGGRGGGGRR